MPKYMFTGSFTEDGIRGIQREGGTSRRAVVEKMVSSVGGTFESYYFALGEDDFFIIVELPDNETAAAVSLTVAVTGAVRARTIALLTAEEVDAATKKSIPYRAPGA